MVKYVIFYTWIYSLIGAPEIWVFGLRLPFYFYDEERIIK